MKLSKKIEKKGRNFIKKSLGVLLRKKDVLFDPKKIRSVLVIRIDERMGNLVLLNAVVRSFIKQNIKTSLMVCRKYGRIYEYNRQIRELILFDKKALFNPLNILKLVQRLRSRKYDLLFDASNPNDLSTLTFFMILFVKAHVKFGYRRKESELILNRTVVRPGRRHILDYYKLLFEELNLRFYKDIRFSFPVSIRRKYQYLRKKGKDIVIVHPGGRSNKQWAVQKLIEFLKIAADKNHKFLILLGPDEGAGEKFFLHHGFNIVKPENIIELISVLSTGRIYIGNDSGPMHLAAALGLSVFAVFKPDASIVFEPVASHYKMVISEYPPDLSIKEVFRNYRQFLKKAERKM
ncbi:MAG: glycosyltransferase family 9 protein [Spirochaetes bacterium]|nr:glycosyltransferase family 9 protein [Spirochaetota bacterium]